MTRKQAERICEILNDQTDLSWSFDEGAIGGGIEGRRAGEIAYEVRRDGGRVQVRPKQGSRAWRHHGERGEYVGPTWPERFAAAVCAALETA